MLISLFCDSFSLLDVFTALLTIFSGELVLLDASVRYVNGVILVEPADSRGLDPSTWLGLYTLNREGGPALRPEFTKAFESTELWVWRHEQHSYLLVNAKDRLNPLSIKLIAVLQDLLIALLFDLVHTLIQHLQDYLILHDRGRFGQIYLLIEVHPVACLRIPNLLRN
jgi:hypothetical protein